MTYKLIFFFFSTSILFLFIDNLPKSVLKLKYLIHIFHGYLSLNMSFTSVAIGAWPAGDSTFKYLNHIIFHGCCASMILYSIQNTYTSEYFLNIFLFPLLIRRTRQFYCIRTITIYVDQ